ncbi:MAG TPA: translation elongation factor Ts [Planctomycetota bacterium]|nr:translation elongation factor Ts [Planctomycetota bacterium]
MTNIPATLVKQLRDKTGLGMGDCKKALVESNGDLNKAIEILRKKGLDARDKKAGRAQGEGLVAIQVAADKKSAALVALGCETDFVARNEKFREFLTKALNAAIATKANTVADLNAAKLDDGTVDSACGALVALLGENISIKELKWVSGDVVSFYLHHDGKKGAMVGFTGEIAEGPAREIALQIVSSPPLYFRRADVPAEVIAKEKEIQLAKLKEDPKNAAKPQEIQEKIVEGQLNRFFSEQCLVDQPYCKDDKLTVTKYLKQAAPKAEIKTYAFYLLG